MSDTDDLLAAAWRASGPQAADAPGERAGDRIDRYELIEELGRGGMGVVWLARQSEPVRRDVALKVIKLGMDTREVVVRFEAERQALALMDHPHIAKVLDGGATESGRPFFVMELVRGAPITEYCDSAEFGLRERLELFAKVCEAVQHAHHKGVIHRDIKPSNVLVTDSEAGPQPTVIDFGVAKATSAELTQRTLFTQHAQVIGTPEYMAPEQAGLANVDIDTRADVYSLGVLLYELLTGTKPFDVRNALAEGYDALLRTIREEEPAKPSTRVSTLGKDATHIAAQRHVNVESLSKRLRGDLDWIVMKALEKDRGRRYATASAFAADVSRYLTNETVLAAPPNAGYRLRKFVMRRRKSVAVGAIIALLFIGGSIGTGVGLWRSVRANEALGVALGRANEVQSVIDDMLSLVSPWNALGADTSLIEAMTDDVAARLESGEIEDELVAAELHLIIGHADSSLSRLQRAEHHLSQAYEVFERHGHPRLREATVRLGRLRYAQGRLDEARTLLEDAGLGAEPFVTESVSTDLAATSIRREAETLLGRIHMAYGEYEQGIALQRRAIEAVEREQGSQHATTLVAKRELAQYYMQVDRRDDAGVLLDEVLSLATESLGEMHPVTFDALVRKADHLRLQGDYAAAREVGEQAVTVGETLHGDEGLDQAHAYEVLGTTCLTAGDPAAAAPLLERSIELHDAALGAVHPSSAETRGTLAETYQEIGRYAEALELARVAERLEVQLRGRASSQTVYVIASCLRVNGRFDEAVELLQEALADQASSEEPPIERARLLSILGTIHRDRGKLEAAAAAWRELVEIEAAIDPESVQLLGSRANVCLVLNQLGRYEEAIEILEPTVARMRAELPPHHPWTHNGLGSLAMAYRGAGRLEDAVAIEREEIEFVVAMADQEDAHPEAIHRAAWTLFMTEGELRDLDRALLYAERMLAAAESTNAHMHSTLAQIQYARGELEAAVAAMEAALDVLDPGSAQFESFEAKLGEYREEL